jgi:hypothetical protein
MFRTGTSVGKRQMFRPTSEDWSEREKKYIVLVVCFMHGLASTRCKDARKEGEKRR